MLPNFSNLRVGQRNKNLSKRGVNVQGKVPSEYVPTAEDQARAWLAANRTAKDRAFAWFVANPNHEDAADPITTHLLSEGYPQDDLWNGKFWFVTGSWSGAYLNKALPTYDEPQSNWFEQTSVVDVPKKWAEPGPDSIIQVTPAVGSYPGEFAHKATVLIMFATQRSQNPDLGYPDAYKSPGGTGRDLFVPPLTKDNAEQHAQMSKILDEFLAECETIKCTVDGEGGRVHPKLYDRDADLYSPLRNPFPTPWRQGNGKQVGDYNETDIIVNNNTVNLATNEVMDDWEYPSDDDGSVGYEPTSPNYGSPDSRHSSPRYVPHSPSYNPFESDDGPPEDESVSRTHWDSQDAPNDAQRFQDLFNDVSARPEFYLSEAAQYSGDDPAVYAPISLLNEIGDKWSRDDLYVDMFTDDMMDGLWEQFSDGLTKLYTFFELIPNDNTSMFPKNLQDNILWFLLRLVDSNKDTTNRFLSGMILANRLPITRWIDHQDRRPRLQEADVRLLARVKLMLEKLISTIPPSLTRQNSSNGYTGTLTRRQRRS